MTESKDRAGPRHSAIYRGSVRHRRHDPVPHTFRYRVYLLYLDLDEVATVFDGRWFWSYERRNWMSFRRRDFLGDPTRPLRECVLDVVEQQAGRRPSGPVRLLTSVRALGTVFNPVTFYYCFAADGERLEAVVAEITNTPWRERHRYVALASSSPGPIRVRFAKDFHVSPFLPMNQEYDWTFSVPDRQLVVHMENRPLPDAPDGSRSEPAFDATLTLRRSPWTGRGLAKVLLLHPCIGLKVLLGIYFQALRLWLKRAPFFAHPNPARGETRES